MANNEQTGSGTGPSAGGIGKSITQSFLNRVNRVKGELDPEVDMGSAGTPAPLEPPLQGLNSVDKATTPVSGDSSPVDVLATPVSSAASSVASSTPATASEVSPTSASTPGPTPEIESPSLGSGSSVSLGSMMNPTSTLEEDAAAETTELKTDTKATEVVPAKKPKITVSSSRPKASRQTRRARLRISRVDPWSVMKTALLFGVAGWIMFIVATWIVFGVLEMTGLYEAVNSTVAQIFASPDQTDDFNITDFINTTRVTALAALIGAVNVVILTALATIFAFLYNLTAIVMGGVEVTMAED